MARILSPEQRAQRNARARAKYAQKRPVLSPEQRAKKAIAWRRWWIANAAKVNHRKRANRKRTAAYVRNKRIRQQERQAGRRKPEVCEVCADGRSKIHFDHCHQRGVFRGWICGNCNAILGHAHDDPDRLRKLIAYLERTRIIVPPQLTLPGI